MARLNISNIKYINVITKDGIEYSFYVCLFGNDSRTYHNMKDGKTTADHYSRKLLPVSVQRFLNIHECREIEGYSESWNGHEYRHYQYK